VVNDTRNQAVVLGLAFISAIESSFLEVDEELRALEFLALKRGGGSTACAVWIKVAPQTVACAAIDLSHFLSVEPDLLCARW
jgi:hypothetical protein